MSALFSEDAVDIEDSSGQEKLSSAETSERSSDGTEDLRFAGQSEPLFPARQSEQEDCRWPLDTASVGGKTSPTSVSSSSWLEESDGVEAVDLCGPHDTVRVVWSTLEAVSL